MLPTVPLQYPRRSAAEMEARARALTELLQTRRSVRDFAPDSIPQVVLQACLAAAASAPSGANKQPWTFVVVQDPETKRRIREAAEVEERTFYAGRAGERWLEDLEPLGTGPEKPFLETAPALIAVFAHRRGAEAGQRNYYVDESVGIASGMLLAALHHAGLASLTHTPSPMAFLSEILERPAHERAYLLIPVGYPAEGCRVPDLKKKPLDEVVIWR